MRLGTSSKTSMISALFVAMAIGLLSASARASFHEWKIIEIYSNASGSVQFIEMFDPFSGENFVSGFSITSNANTFTFDHDLVGTTTNKHLLIATSGFGSLPGGVTPDFTLPINFFDTTGDTIDYTGLSSLTFGPGDLPIDGVSSLNRAWGDTDSGTGDTNSPTNFAGQSGSLQVPEPAAMALLTVASVWMTIRPRGSRRRSNA